MKNEVAAMVFDPGRRHVVLLRRGADSQFEFPGGEWSPGMTLAESASARFKEQTGVTVGPERWRKLVRLDARQDRRIHFMCAAVGSEDFDLAGVFRIAVNDLPLMGPAAPVLWAVFLALDMDIAEPVVVKRK